MASKIKSWFIDDKDKPVYIPRVWQIILTCILLGLLIIAWIDQACYLAGANITDMVNAALYGYDSSTVRDFFTYYLVNEMLPIILVILEYVVSALFIIFLWKEMPRKAFSSSLLFLIFPIVFIINVKHYNVDGYSRTLNDFGFIGIGFIVLSVVMVILSFVMVRKVKDGTRPPKQVAVVSAPASKPSASDELLKLKELLDKEVITQEEYDSKRDDLVSKL